MLNNLQDTIRERYYRLLYYVPKWMIGTMVVVGILLFFFLLFVGITRLVASGFPVILCMLAVAGILLLVAFVLLVTYNLPNDPRKQKEKEKVD